MIRMKPNRLALLLAALAAMLSPAAAQDPTNPAAVSENAITAPPLRPSIVLVQFHGLGYGDLSCYGQKLFQTPNLDQLAAEGVRFENYFAGNIGTTPSPGVLMHGKTAAPAGGEPTLAQRLQQAGYRTGLIGEWGLGDEPWKQGFGEFCGFLDDEQGRNYFAERIRRFAPRAWITDSNTLIDYNDWEAIHANTGGQKGRYLPELLVNAACTWINANFSDQFNNHRPFFLLLNLPAPRSAHAGTDEFTVTSDAPFSDEKWPPAAKNRVALITRLDAGIGKIAAQLAANRLTNEVLFIVTSSAPPEPFANTNLNFLRPNGNLSAATDRAGAPLPFIARWTGTIPPGQTNAASISAADLLPTVLELIGQKVPEQAVGRSLLPAFTGETGEKKNR
jgi:uncharacterized sulfatase